MNQWCRTAGALAVVANYGFSCSLVKCRMVNARDSHGNASGVFISLEGWWTLAGGNTPRNRPATLRPGRAPESILSCPIRPIGPIRLIQFPHPQTTPHPQSTLAHPKSTLALGCEGLIKVENGLRPHLSPTCYRPIIRPENKGIKPNSNRYKPKNLIMSRYAKRLPARVWPSAKPGHDAANHPQGPHSCPLFWYPTPTIASLCQPMPATPPLSFFRDQSRILIHRHFSIQSYSKQFKAIQGFLKHFFIFMRHPETPAHHSCRHPISVPFVVFVPSVRHT